LEYGTRTILDFTYRRIKKEVNLIKFAVIFIGVAMVIMTVSGMILTIRKGFSALSFTALGFLPLVLIFSLQLKQIKTELKKRAQ